MTRSRRPGSAALVFMLMATLPTACGGSASDYAAAAVGLGVAVAATGAHRARTGDCWARCAYGFACNPRSGLCERGDCSPACPGTMSCVVTPTGSECRGQPDPAFDPFEGDEAATESR